MPASKKPTSTSTASGVSKPPKSISPEKDRELMPPPPLPRRSTTVKNESRSDAAGPSSSGQKRKWTENDSDKKGKGKEVVIEVDDDDDEIPLPRHVQIKIDKGELVVSGRPSWVHANMTRQKEHVDRRLRAKLRGQL